MIEKQNKIIIVDNSEDELERLGKAFLKIGVGCRTFLYETDYDAEPLKNVRIAFFDINLTLGKEFLSGEEKEEIIEHHSSVLNELAYAIEQFISIDNGPFALIFWTKNKELIDAFIQYVNERQINIPNPIIISHIDKTEINEGNIETLPQLVLDLLNSNEKIKFLFDLENNAKKSGENTLNRIYDILPKNDPWGESQQLFKDLDKVLSKIAASTLGFEHAKENPKKAVYEGLLPILNYEFLNNESNVNWNSIVNQLHNAQKYKELISPDINIQYKVNTLYHIEDYVNQSKDVRGSLIEINKDSEEILETLNIENISDWISSLLAIKDGNQPQKARKTEIIENSKLIAIELSAACDFSNKKSRINKYILGVLTSNLNNNIENDLNLKSRPESCYHLGGCCFHHDGNNYHIWLNLNYVFGAKPEDKRLGNTLFILKKEIMDMLGNKYASHISRIGITSF
jgi:hypothetical protein